MASVLNLLHESSQGLKERARNTDGVKVSLTKFEHIDAFSDEDLGEKAEVILKSSRPDLVAAAEEVGIAHADVAVAGLKELLLEQVCGFSKGAESLPYPTEGQEEKIPDGESSHFETPKMRKNAVEAAAQKAAKRAVQDKVTYHVIESFKAEDKTEPLSIARAYPDHSENEIIVATVTVPAVHWPIQTANGSSIVRG